MRSNIGIATLVVVLAVSSTVVTGEVLHTSPVRRTSTVTATPLAVPNLPQVEIQVPAVRPQFVQLKATRLEALPPLTLSIPSQSIRARITMRAKIDPKGLLTAPDNPKQLGWWDYKTGALVIDGHVGINHVPGALVAIGKLRSGTKLFVEDIRHGIHRYLVVKTTVIPKGGLPASYFSSMYNGWLLLITCGGSFDSSIGHYRDNIITLARPV